MNKKLLAAAVAAGLAAPMAANAGVTVYGLAQLELQSVEVNGGDSETTLAENKNARIGVKWEEDLGGGLTAIGEMEFGPKYLDAAIKEDCSVTTTTTTTDTTAPAYTSTSTCSNTGNSGLYARQANMGLKGGFGEVRFGTVYQPYKYSGGVKYDAFVATVAEARGGNGGMIKTHFGQGGYFANAISWKKKFDNVTVWLATSLDEGADAGNSYVGRDGDIMASVTVGLGKGAEVGVAMASDDIGGGATSGTAGEENTKIFGKYTMGAHQIMAQFEQRDVVAANSDEDYIFLAYRFTMGKNMFVAQLGETDRDGPTSAGDVDYMALGVFHNFSKKTSAFLAYLDKDAAGGNAGDKSGFSLGLRTKF